MYRLYAQKINNSTSMIERYHPSLTNKEVKDIINQYSKKYGAPVYTETNTLAWYSHNTKIEVIVYSNKNNKTINTNDVYFDLAPSIV
jgi:uncharacterized Fe-S center protein